MVAARPVEWPGRHATALVELLVADLSGVINSGRERFRVAEERMARTRPFIERTQHCGLFFSRAMNKRMAMLADGEPVQPVQPFEESIALFGIAVAQKKIQVAIHVRRLCARRVGGRE